MSKGATARSRRSGSSLTFPTFILITMGALVFYFASQAVTPEYAHLTHWGLAVLGGFLGWVIGTVADRWSRSRP
jgi:uncharacterized membrane protein AbrB (regulator of aidB expression)